MKKRRWHQLRLRTLLLLTALVAVVLGLRVPQRFMARYHDYMKSRHQAAWRQGFTNGIETPQGTADRDMYWRHRELAEQYRSAIEQPWVASPDQMSHSK